MLLEDRAFLDAVRGVGDDVRAPYHEALRTHRLAVAVGEAARSTAPTSAPTPTPTAPGPADG
jgi:myo-inositol 2-dehydrogenase / D-chiro-inositol 1-dehydrogenase